MHMVDHDLLSESSGSRGTISLRMKLLGSFALEIQGARVTISSHRMQVLLAYLALHRTELLSRQFLAFLLWPDSSETQAFTNLRTLLHRLYGALADYAYLIEADSQFIRWSPEFAMSLDVEAFEETISNAETATKNEDDDFACFSLEQAVVMYGGDLLPDCYDEWILSQRERLNQLRLTALEHLIMFLEKQRRYAAAIPYARQLVQLDALNEAAYLMLMRLHALNGDRASALRVYHTCTSVLQNELSIEPGSALKATYERLLAAESVLPSETPMKSVLPLVGRDQAWKRMQLAWQTAVSGQPRFLLLSGEAGVGKTRLAEDFLRWASRQGITTAVTQCYPAEGDLAYTPVATLIRSDVLMPNLKQLGAEWLSEIARVVPDLMTTTPDIQPPDPVTEQWQRHRFFEALARAVLPNDRAILLHFDDLQWCDRDSLQWLHFLLRFRQSARLLVVGTVRIEEISASHPLVDLLDALRREGRVSEIPLDPLTREETAELATSISGRALGPDEIEHLYADTEGNALFIVEMMRGQSKTVVGGTGFEDSLLTPRAVQSADLPPRVQAVIAWRLKQLSSEAAALLEIAATIGRSFTFRILTRAADVDENQLVRGLDELWQRRILREQGPDAYYFTHDKLRSVAYLQLSRVRQSILHRRVAEALEGVYASEHDDMSGQIAIHYEQAGLVDQAVTYYRGAAVYARHLYAHDVAIAHLQRALTLLGEQTHPQKRELYDLLGEIQHFTGLYGDARESWRLALLLVPELDRLVRANLYRKLGNAWRDQYHYDEALQAYNAAEKVLGNLAHGDPEALRSCWVEIELERLNVFYWLGQTTEMLDLIESIEERFQHYPSKLQQGRLHQISAIGLLRHNRYSASLQAANHARAYLSVIQEMGESGALPAAHFQAGFTVLWATDDIDSAEREIDTALTLAERSGDISLKGRCLTYLTVISRLRGHVEQVQIRAGQSLEVATTVHMYDYIGAAHGNLAWIAWRSGDLAAVHVHGQEALEAWGHLPVNYMFEWIGRWPLIGLALGDDNLSEALSHSQVLLDKHQNRMPETIERSLEAAIHASGAGDLALSRVLLYQATESARKLNYL